MQQTVENLSKRKNTGGKTTAFRGRFASEKNRYPSETVLGDDNVYPESVRGNISKNRLRASSFANVSDSSIGNTVKSKIASVKTNPASRDYSRRGVITKGSIIVTDLGEAKVISRPGQHGIVNAVLIK